MTSNMAPKDTASEKPPNPTETSLQERIEAEVPLIELKLENVTYAPVTKSAGSKRTERKRTIILNSISTTLSPGKLTAFMGASGSGKTSLVSVIGGLVDDADIVEGSHFYINGTRGDVPRRFVGLVYQEDLLLSNLSVFENVFYIARLKMPESITDAEVRKSVDETVDELGLTHVRNSLVGSILTRGISGGERKRVSVACELVTKPSVLLLDEPTSGLDATTAKALMHTLRQLANKGHSVAVVIHQPRTEIYNMFDHILLLSKGNVIYDGTPKMARSYLESCPSVGELPPETGIADWLMDVITEDERRGKEALLPKVWAEYNQKDSVHAGETSYKLQQRMSTLEELHAVPKFNTRFITQLLLLTKRTMKQQRGERLASAVLMLQFAYLFFTAVFWWRVPTDTAHTFDHNSLFFFMLIAQSNGIVINAVTVFQRDRALLRRERRKKLYGLSSYFIGKTLSDMSTNVLLPVGYAMIVYWTAAYRPTAAAYFKFILSMYLTFSAAQSMGLFLSIVIPSASMALVLAPPLTLFFMIMGGFYIPFQNMHRWIKWATWLSFARYGYSSLIINQYQGLDIPCSSDSSLSVSVGGGHSQCPLPGEDVISSLGITGVADNYWFNIGMVIALQVVFRIAAYAWLRRTK